MKRDERLQLRIASKLKKQMEAYAERRHTTLSDLVAQYFVQLLEEEESRQQETLDAESI